MGMHHAVDRGEFWRISRRVGWLIDLSSRLPEWVFWGKHGFVSFFDHAHVLSGGFGEVLEGLAQTYGDESVDVVVFDPPMPYYRDGYGFYPGFIVDSDSLLQGYEEGIGSVPGGDLKGALRADCHDIGIAGSSGKWMVWSQRDWGIGLLVTPDETGPWLSANIPVFDRNIDIETLLESVGSSISLSEQDKEMFSDTISKFGSGQ